MKPDHEDTALEALLKQLTPPPPSDELLTRLRRARPRRKPLRLVLWAAPFAAAAAIALLISLPGQRTQPNRRLTAALPPAEKPQTLVPIESRQTLVKMDYLGVRETPGQPPVGLYRATWLDEFDLGQPGGPAQARESFYREQYIPVSLASF